MKLPVIAPGGSGALADASSLRHFVVPRAATPSAFDALAHEGLVEVLMVDLDTELPHLFLVNGKHFGSAYELYVRGLGRASSFEDFVAATWFCEAGKRKNLAGTVRHHDAAYVLELWPGDAVDAMQVATALLLLKKALPFAARQLAFHPRGDAQDQAVEDARERLSKLGIKIVTEGMFRGVVTDEGARRIFAKNLHAPKWPGASVINGAEQLFVTRSGKNGAPEIQHVRRAPHGLTRQQVLKLLEAIESGDAPELAFTVQPGGEVEVT